jgi:hypothetical protein
VTTPFATFAHAQGFFYKEIHRDGRVYVFNIAANADRFERTGEIVGGITKAGAAVNGETLVGDNERALQLYFFKHGMSVAVPEAPAASVVWRDGKTRITTEAAYLEIGSRIQVRYTHEDPDDSSRLAGTGEPGDSRGSFRIRRAKFKLEGWMLRRWLSYEVQTNWPAAGSSNPGTLLEDAAFDIDVTKGRGLFRAHVGQFKVPFGAQDLTSSGSQQFVDRALVSNVFFRGRDIGAALWGATPDNRIEWRVGMFNGNGPTRTANDNASFQYNARVMWQPNGSQPLNGRPWVTGALYSEADFESTTTPIYAVAVNWEHQNTFGTTSGNDQRWHAVSFDGIFKFKGISVNGMYTFAGREEESGGRFDARGGFIQGGKLFAGRRYEVAFRYGAFDPDDRIGRDVTREARGALNYYFARHGLKWQTDAGRIEVSTPAGRSRLFELRSQLQFVF